MNISWSFCVAISLMAAGSASCTRNKPDGRLSTFIGSPPPAEIKEPGFERNGLTVSMRRSYLDQFPDWQRNVIEGARFEKVDQGFRIVRIKEDSLYRKLGLWNNDVILVPKDLPDSFIASLKEDRDISIVFLRSGEKQLLKIQIEE